jgi:hypothetical protein
MPLHRREDILANKRSTTRPKAQRSFGRPPVRLDDARGAGARYSVLNAAVPEQTAWQNGEEKPTMSLAQQLDNDATRGEYEDFVDRCQRRGAQSCDDREVLARYEEVALEIPPGDYEQAAASVLCRMSLEERHDFLRDLERQAEVRRIPLPIGGTGYAAERESRPQQFAEILTGLNQQEPGLIAAIFSGRRGGRPTFGSPASKLALAGIAAISLRRLLNRRRRRTVPTGAPVGGRRLRPRRAR